MQIIHNRCPWLGGPRYRCRKPLPPKRSKTLAEIDLSTMVDLPYESRVEDGPAVSVVFRKRDRIMGRAREHLKLRLSVVESKFARRRRRAAATKEILEARNLTQNEIWAGLLIWRALHVPN